MTPIAAFSEATASWQAFYMLVGEAAATLIGLMFVAITFGSSLVRPETSQTARAFLDPVFGHFAQVLFTACLVVVPTMRPVVLAALLFLVAILRLVALARIARHTLEASRRSNDIELSDWASGVVVPFLAYLALGTSAVAFVEWLPLAFIILAASTLLTLFNGLYCAWELMVWMAITRAHKP